MVSAGSDCEDRRSLRVGIIDDDCALASELADEVRATGHVAEEIAADTLAHGLFWLNQDVVILDVVMPGVDGLDVLDKLSRCERPPAVILMSGHGEAVLRGATEAARRSGLTVVGGLAKPFQFDELGRLIEGARAPPEPSATAAPGPFAIRSAVARAVADGTLAINFQPILDADTFAFAGAEGLLQGVLPGLPPVPPARIVEAVAADDDLLAALSWVVVRQAAAAAQRWTLAGYRGRVAVNMPASVLRVPGAVEMLQLIVGGAGLKPEQMALELIEENVYDEAAATLATLVKLRVAGFGLLLDDVGRRESGLTQLSALPVTGLKIDIELLRAARSWEKPRFIFAALARLGADLGLTVTAEGVETRADAEFARDQGATHLQGYLFARKLTLDDLMAALPNLQAAAAASATGRPVILA